MDSTHRRIDKHCSNLQVANYPTIERRLWDAADAIPLRKKAHADSGTLTILARGAATEGTAGGLQVLLDGRVEGVPRDTWVDVPVLPGGVLDGEGGGALLVNLGNQMQRWTDDKWRSTKHRVTNPDVVSLSPASSSSTATAPRRLSIAFFHKANYDAVIDPASFIPAVKGGGGEVVLSGRNPAVESGDISRVGLLHKAAARGLDAREASMVYHQELMGVEAATVAASAATSVTARVVPASADYGDNDHHDNNNAGLDIDRGNSEEGAGAGNDNPNQNCPVCHGTGWKPCGQCGGTGVNQEDLYGSKFKKGDTCWLCAGKCKTMCGNCVDLTDEF